MTGWWRGRCAIYAGVGLHLQEVVWLIFDDVDIVLLRNLVDGLASFSRLGSTCGVLSGGDGVEHNWLAGASSSFVPVAQNVVHRFGKKTLLIHLHWCGLNTERESRLRGTGECIFFHQDIIPSLSEQAQSRVPAVGAAGVETALPVRVWRVVYNLWSISWCHHS